MIQSINPFFHFNGNGAEAMKLYESALGAKVALLMPWSELPGRTVPPEMAAQIMYARLEIGAGTIELCDAPPNVAVERGNNNRAAVQCTDPEELDRIFEALAEGGRVEMAPENMFWGARHAKLCDRFGISWTFNCPLER